MATIVRIAPVAPWNAGKPAIHGPALTGASAGKPFFYAIPATGERPLRFGIEGLPEGLSVNPATGHVVGVVRRDGVWHVLFTAKNRHGTARKEFDIVIGQGLALTPPLGWNSWNAWRRWVDDAKVRASAQAMVDSGLVARGYTYVNIDSCWQGVRGGALNAIQPNSKFPDMKALGSFLHGLGLKFGIYSTPWVEPWGCSAKEAEADWGGGALIGCSSGEHDPEYPRISEKLPGQIVGREKHEPADVAQWVEWGVDFLKYDWRPTDPKCLERMGRAVKAAPRDIILSVCTGARLEWIEAYRQWTQMYRGIPDTNDSWNSLLKNAFFADDWICCQRDDWRPHIRPGFWNDLDMLALGPQFSTRADTRPNRLTPDEQIAHMTFWALYPSPLILSCALEAMSDFDLRLFGNEEILAINQDRLGTPAVRIHAELCQPADGKPPRRRIVHARPLADGSYAAGLFNPGDADDDVMVSLRDLGIAGAADVRNLWERRDCGCFEERVTLQVPAHGAQCIRLIPR